MVYLPVRRIYFFLYFHCTPWGIKWKSVLFLRVGPKIVYVLRGRRHSSISAPGLSQMENRFATAFPLRFSESKIKLLRPYVVGRQEVPVPTFGLFSFHFKTTALWTRTIQLSTPSQLVNSTSIGGVSKNK